MVFSCMTATTSHKKHFFSLQQYRFTKIKAKFRHNSNCSKRVTEPSNLVSTTKTRKMTFQKLDSCKFRQIAKYLFQTKLSFSNSLILVILLCLKVHRFRLQYLISKFFQFNFFSKSLILLWHLSGSFLCWNLFKVKLSLSKKVVFICFNERPLKMMKNAFYLC